MASAAGAAGFRASLDLGSKRMTYGVFYRRSSAIGTPAGFALERTTRCEKGLRENHKRTSPRRTSRTTSRRVGCNASKMSTGFCSPGNPGRDGNHPTCHSFRRGCSVIADFVLLPSMLVCESSGQQLLRSQHNRPKMRSI
jgi:hypothetical protein